MELSVQVVDARNGFPAAEIGVRLSRETERGWERVACGGTRGDGRLVVARSPDLPAGNYQLELNLDDYYALQGDVPLFPKAVVEFRLGDVGGDLHLPMLISPHSILTYRGVPR
ncbi:hypothetical protein GCM10022224_052400 [Nonomuraea antimicrobica]|uniref:Transthyretin/hydroxyisourate hydrolase domain-containing protein n=1 Tax=Nonomuraea antimicrobica TaxID=561173 RepID=A0ABP7CB94_9ACTN